MSAPSRRLLFVCTGNTCRSPLARFLLERRAREAGLPWTGACAGLSAEPGAALSGGAARALAARGIAGVAHAARPLDAAALDAADAVYALTRAHRDAILARWPRAAGKLAVLREAAGLPEPDVADPVGGDDAAYEACAARIDEALDVLVRRHSHA